jgi:hypothetical protein
MARNDKKEWISLYCANEVHQNCPLTFKYPNGPRACNCACHLKVEPVPDDAKGAA